MYEYDVLLTDPQTETLRDLLNDRGAQGWRLVHARSVGVRTLNGAVEKALLILERQKEADMDPAD